MRYTRHSKQRTERVVDKRKSAIVQRILDWYKCQKSLRDGKYYIYFKDSNNHDRVAVLAEDVLITILDAGRVDLHRRVRRQMQTTPYTEEIKDIIRFGEKWAQVMAYLKQEKKLTREALKHIRS